MDLKFYETVYSRLSLDSDLKSLSKETKIKEDTLTAMLHQKIVRGTLKRHHTTKAKAKQLLREWQQGKTFTEISREIEFPPVMTAWLILEKNHISRKKFRDMTRRPDLIQHKRLREELSEALEADIVYSPKAIESQGHRSKMVEDAAREWLESQDIGYVDEEEAKKNGQGKTPDFLLKDDLEYEGKKVFWVECKGSFGDEMEASRDYRKQIRHYIDLWGPGIVVYWYGFLDTLNFDDVTLVSRELFD